MTRVTQDAAPLHSVWITMSAWLQQRMLAAIAWYQAQRTGLPSPCRFFPSCSEYAHDAISAHGPARGGWLTLRRLARCRPFGASGYDPVPLAHAACQAEHYEQETTHV